MIFIAGISISLFVLALLLVKKNKNKSDILLLIWMLLYITHLGYYYIDSIGQRYDYPHLLGFSMPFPLLHCVLMFFYVSHVTNQVHPKRSISLLHFIPALSAYVYLIPFFLLSTTEKIEIFKLEGGENYGLFAQILQVSISLSGIIYVVWCSFLLIKHKKNIRSQFSDIEEISLSWLQFLVVGMGLVWFLVIVTQNDNIIAHSVAVFVILIGFFGVQQKSIFNNTQEVHQKPLINEVDQETTEPLPTREKYRNSGLTKDLAEEHFQRLNDLMNEGQFYKNANLSLGELASELELHPNYLSQIINNNGGQSFYDYVNTFRVNEFKKLLAKPENQKYTLMTLAFECGFNSKSSFNRYFKKITGKTPSQYSKQ